MQDSKRTIKILEEAAYEINNIEYASILEVFAYCNDAAGYIWNIS